MPDLGTPTATDARRVMYVAVKPFATYTADELLELYEVLADLNDADLYVVDGSP